MSYTEKVVGNLNKESSQQLNYYRYMLCSAREKKSDEIIREYVVSINAFLTCLMVNGNISQHDKRVLWVWYTR